MSICDIAYDIGRLCLEHHSLQLNCCWTLWVEVVIIILTLPSTCVISLIRIVLLPKLDLRDATYSQVFPGTLTYAELGVAIICGNLPVMGPLFGRWFKNKMSSYRTKKAGYGYSFGQSAPGNSTHTGTFTKVTRDRDGFARMPSSKAHSEDDQDVELTIQSNSNKGPKPLAIEVTRELAIDYQRVDGQTQNGDTRKQDFRSGRPEGIAF